MPACHLRHDRARRKRFRDDPPLVRVTPPSPATNATANLDAPSRRGSVNYMVDHICEPMPSTGSHLPNYAARCKMGAKHCLRRSDRPPRHTHATPCGCPCAAPTALLSTPPISAASFQQFRALTRSRLVRPILRTSLCASSGPLLPQLLPASRRRCPWLEYYADTSRLVRSCLERIGPPRSIRVPA
jgi:hypothetical protein